MEIRRIQHSKEMAWLEDLWKREWGGITMVSRGKTYHLHSLISFLAEDDANTPVGAITLAQDNDRIEIMSLNSVRENLGIGTSLLMAAERYSTSIGATKISLITSNDNLRALGFYQKRGYRMRTLYPGAIDEARRMKPTIPLIASNGIPLHDEIELDKALVP